MLLSGWLGRRMLGREISALPCSVSSWKACGDFSDSSTPAPHCPHQELGAEPRSPLLGPWGLLQPKPRHPIQAKDCPVAMFGLPPAGLCPPQVRSIPPSPPSPSSSSPPSPASSSKALAGWGGLVPLISSAHPWDPVPCHPPWVQLQSGQCRDRGDGVAPTWGRACPWCVCTSVYKRVCVEHVWYQGQVPPSSPRSLRHLCCALRAKAQQSWFELVWANPRC